MKCSELKIGMRVGTYDLPWCDAESPFATVEAVGPDWAVLRTPNGNTYLSSDEDDLEEYVPPTQDPRTELKMYCRHCGNP